MARLKSELEVACPCCQTVLVIDTNLGRVVSHKEPDRGNKPELSDAQKILAAEAARREEIGRASCRERVESWEGAESVREKHAEPGGTDGVRAVRTESLVVPPGPAGAH